MKTAEKIPKWNEEYFEELKTLMGKLESVPNGPLRDYILDDCLTLATSVLNKILAEVNVRGFDADSPKQLSA